MCYKIIKSFKHELVNTIVSLPQYILKKILERIIDFTLFTSLPISTQRHGATKSYLSSIVNSCLASIITALKRISIGYSGDGYSLSMRKVVIVDVEWVMIAFIMGSALYQWVGWANVYCDPGVRGLF